MFARLVNESSSCNECQWIRSPVPRVGTRQKAAPMKSQLQAPLGKVWNKMSRSPERLLETLLCAYLLPMPPCNFGGLPNIVQHFYKADFLPNEW